MIGKPNTSIQWVMGAFVLSFSIKFWQTIALKKINHIHKFVVKNKILPKIKLELLQQHVSMYNITFT